MPNVLQKVGVFCLLLLPLKQRNPKEILVIGPDFDCSVVLKLSLKLSCKLQSVYLV